VSLCSRSVRNGVGSMTRELGCACALGQSGRVKETPMCDRGDCWNSHTLVVREGWTNLKVRESLISQASFWGVVRIILSWANNFWYGPWSRWQLAGCLSGEILTKFWPTLASKLAISWKFYPGTRRVKSMYQLKIDGVTFQIGTLFVLCFFFKYHCGILPEKIRWNVVV
jgi:hypothetical protein